MFCDVLALNNKRAVFINARIEHSVILIQSCSYLTVDPTKTEGLYAAEERLGNFKHI